jgi:hypothetical protein
VDGLEAGGVSQHRGRFVHARDAVAEPGERTTESPDVTPEVEHGGTAGERSVDHQWSLARGEAHVHLDGAAVRGDVGGGVVRPAIRVHAISAEERRPARGLEHQGAGQAGS